MRSNPAINIFLENVNTFKERREIFSLTEAEEIKLSNNMITKLYTSAINKKHVNFEGIPQSKGDVTKYSGYTSMVESLTLLRQIADNNNHKIDEIGIVEKALGNIVAYRDVFEKGFKLNKEFIIMEYNVLVYTCVSAISYLIVSYVEYIKRIDKIEFSIVDSRYGTGYIGISSLDSFNKSVASGDFAKSINSVVKSGVHESLSVAAGVAGGIILGSIGLVAIIRRMIFQFYYSRMKLSNYLEVQAYFLELNKNNINANSNRMSPDKKKEVIRKQEALIAKLHSYADKLKVDSTMTDKKVESEIKKENSGWTLNNIKSEVNSTDDTGILLI